MLLAFCPKTGGWQRDRATLPFSASQLFGLEQTRHEVQTV